MSAPLVVVFENAPESKLPAWASQVLAETKLSLVDTEQLHEEMLKDPHGAAAMKKRPNFEELHTLAPFYGPALEKVSGGQPRLAVRGAQWLRQLPKVDAFVFDRGPVESEKARQIARVKPPLTKEKIETLYGMSLRMIQVMVEATLKPDRVLELPPGTTEAEKKAKVSAFLARLG